MSDESEEFEKWLKSAWLEDENRVIRKRKIDELRLEVKSSIVKIMPEIDGCRCDTCVLLYIKKRIDKSIISGLSLVGLEYLLGGNFNGASALYYYTFTKER